MGEVNAARNRILALLDENSFVEIGAKMTARATDFNLQQQAIPSDGVITGYGTLYGNLVYVYSQDFTVLHGSIGEMHAKKITHLYELTLKVGAPLIGLIDCAGIRLQEATDALEGLGSIYYQQCLASGVIPQITAIFGICGGGLALFPAMTDFTFMEESEAKLFVHSPNALAGNIEGLDNQGTAFHSKESGLADFVGSETDVIEKIKDLMQFLPGNYREEAIVDVCDDPLNRSVEKVKKWKGATALLLQEIADHHQFFECKPDFAPSMVTGFIRLNRRTVGCIANQTERYDQEGICQASYEARITSKGCQKAADFITFCDAFQIPIFTVTNAVGFAADYDAEKEIAREAGKLTYAFANATVPKVNLITGDAFGSAYVIMNSKSLGADFVYAWPECRIGMMEPELAARIMYASESKEIIDKKAKEYEALQASVESAARRGYIDTVIQPEDTRKYVIGAFEMLDTKTEQRPQKKHGSV